MMHLSIYRTASLMHRMVRLHRWLRLVLFICVSTHAACGWRLQGAARLPDIMAVTYIDAQDRYTDFHRALRERLSAAGVRLTERRAEASAIIRIADDDSGQRVLAVSARNTPQEYEVYYSVEYSVSTATEQLTAPRRLELTRDYSYDESAVLAMQREQAILRDALARDLADQVIRVLAAH